MKKLLLYTAIAVYAMFAVTVFIDQNARVTFYPPSAASETEPDTAASEPGALYLVTDSGGLVAVKDLATGRIKKTDTPVSVLPREDARRLRSGIEARSEKELRSILEDYCS